MTETLNLREIIATLLTEGDTLADALDDGLEDRAEIAARTSAWDDVAAYAREFV